MTPSREAVSNGVYALLSGISWDTPARSWAYTSQRMQIWTDCPAQPAMYMTEHDEHPTQKTRLLTRNEREFQVVVYQDTAKDGLTPGKVENNLILDAIEDALRPPPGQETQTLGGLVHHCWIEGDVFRDSGDLDGQGCITVPIRVLVP